MIEVRRLAKSFGWKLVLRGLDFRAGPGEFVAIVGPNGAGKTTLLRVLASLSRPTMGEVRIAGYVLPRDASYVRSLLGVVTHQPLLYGDLTAEENLRFYARMYGLRQVAECVDRALAGMGLEARRHDLVRQLSRGMQQRLAIARALFHDPQVLLLDEPHTGLDQDSAAMLDALLRQMASGGRTVVMASHDLSRAADLATRVDVLSQGVIAASMPRAQLDSSGLMDLYRQVTRG